MKRGFQPIPAADVRLARVAGGEVLRFAGNPPGRRYWVSGVVANAVGVARWTAARLKRPPAEVLRALCSVRLFTPQALRPPDIPTHEINVSLAAILGAPVEVGPIRANPDGTFMIRRTDGEWIQATDETLGALDAESRLDGARQMEHLAADTIRKWRRKETDDE